MSSSKKYENYTKFSNYNSKASGKNTTYKTYDTISSQNQVQHQGSSQGEQSPASIGIRKTQQNQYQEGQINTSSSINQNGLPQRPQTSEEQNRVKEIEGTKLYNLLSNPQFYVTKSGSPARIVVKVYTSWCGPCKNIAPRFEEISRDQRYNDVLFVQVDGEKLGDNLAKILNISAVPVFFGFVSGKNVGMVPGTNIAEILTLCDKVSAL